MGGVVPDREADVKLSPRILCAAVVLGINPGRGAAQPYRLTTEKASVRRELFTAVFGKDARMDPEKIRAALEAKPAGTRIPVDRDGDGKTDEVYYVDVDLRHQEWSRPLVVRVIDEDGDMAGTGDGDLDSDLYFYSWKGEPDVCTAVDYTDTDGDGDVDEMALFYYSPDDHYTKKDALRVWWSRDVGDDNLLWYHVNGQYQQAECQWRSHFGGDEVFVAFAYDEAAKMFIPIFENPFCFYDPDKDGNAEIAVRISGIGDRIGCARYSFDADNDSDGENAHDFDFGFTMISKEWAEGRYPDDPKAAGEKFIPIPPDMMRRETIRGIPTGPYVDWARTREFVETSDWARVLLVWDENDDNVDANRERSQEERWEGVIAEGGDGFDRTGSPACGRLNKRYELDRDNSGKMRVYWSTVDRAIHLFGSETSEIRLDIDNDGKQDGSVIARDSDGDGFLDRWEIDRNGDGKAERVIEDSEIPLWSPSTGKLEGTIPPYADLVRNCWSLLVGPPPPRIPENPLSWRTVISKPSPPTFARMDWMAGRDKNIAWESVHGAYRFYDGVVDFFGKQFRSGLFLQSLTGVKEDPYHVEQAWGMDVLNVGTSAGLGGLSLWDGDKEILCRNPGGEGKLTFERKILATGPVRALVEVTTRGVIVPEGPVTIRTRYSIFAGRPETEAETEVLIDGKPVPPDSKIRLGIGLTKIPKDKSLFDPQEGYLGNWGVQDPIVIQEIGLGLILNPADVGSLRETDVDRVLLAKGPPSRPIRYVLLGGWRKGERFPFSFDAGHWEKRLQEYAKRYRNQPRVEIVK